MRSAPNADLPAVDMWIVCGLRPPEKRYYGGISRQGGKPAHAMSHTILGGTIGRHWLAALVACALFSASFAQFAHASGYGYHYSYPYANHHSSYSSSYPYNYNHGSHPYYGNYYGSYSYPTNYYPYGSHYSHQVYNNPPSCSITITPATNYSHNTHRWGYPMQLSWSSSNATSASISPDVGSVSSTGSRVVYAKGQIYSMSVYGPGGTATCQTGGYSVPFYHHDYNYNYSYPQQYYTYPSTYYTPTNTLPITYTSGAANVVNNYVVGSSSKASVSLKQIPYTGLDYGLWGNALAYLAIVLAASYAAWILARNRFRVSAH